MSASSSVRSRLERARKLLELARTSRDLDYAAIPFVVAAEMLVQAALEKQPSPKESS